MSLAAMRDACALHCEIAVLNASEMGHPVYQRMGFHEVGRMNHWEWHNEAS